MCGGIHTFPLVDIWTLIIASFSHAWLENKKIPNFLNATLFQPKELFLFQIKNENNENKLDINVNGWMMLCVMIPNDSIITTTSM